MGNEQSTPYIQWSGEVKMYNITFSMVGRPEKAVVSFVETSPREFEAKVNKICTWMHPDVVLNPEVRLRVPKELGTVTWRLYIVDAAQHPEVSLGDFPPPKNGFLDREKIMSYASKELETVLTPDVNNRVAYKFRTIDWKLLHDSFPQQQVLWIYVTDERMRVHATFCTRRFITYDAKPGSLFLDPTKIQEKEKEKQDATVHPRRTSAPEASTRNTGSTRRFSLLKGRKTTKDMAAAEAEDTLSDLPSNRDFNSMGSVSSGSDHVTGVKSEPSMSLRELEFQPPRTPSVASQTSMASIKPSAPARAETSTLFMYLAAAQFMLLLVLVGVIWHQTATIAELKRAYGGEL